MNTTVQSASSAHLAPPDVNAPKVTDVMPPPESVSASLDTRDQTVRPSAPTAPLASDARKSAPSVRTVPRVTMWMARARVRQDSKDASAHGLALKDSGETDANGCANALPSINSATRRPESAVVRQVRGFESDRFYSLFPGFQGDRCDKPCEDGFYGPDCIKKCKCQGTATASCNRVTGACHCHPGFTGEFCHALCPEGTFGLKCVNECPKECGDGYECDAAIGCCHVDQLSCGKAKMEFEALNGSKSTAGTWFVIMFAIALCGILGIVALFYRNKYQKEKDPDMPTVS